MTSNFLKLAQARYSCRAYEQRAIEQEKIQALCEAARLAPTGCNKQEQRLFVLQSPEALAKIRRCTACHFQAPTVFLLCYDSSDIWHRPFDGWEAGYTDCASVVTHILLAATDLGLGTCWVAYFDPKAVIKEFNLPANLVPAALIPCGYPAQGPCDRHNDRRAISELVKFL